mmetsp:Transcript_136899/g.381628  ORF Transcript_136899/g.381628 Transcript_136899/m.381628 type:complete len:313 (+) Transcript_136899:2-940(+)
MPGIASQGLYPPACAFGSPCSAVSSRVVVTPVAPRLARPPLACGLQPQPPMQPPGVLWRRPIMLSAPQQPEAKGGGRSVTWIEAAPYVPVFFGPGTDFETIQEYFAPPLPKWGDPYKAMLQFVEQSGWLEGLPLDEQGVLRVNVPFCAGFMECQLLLPFLARIFLNRPGLAKVSILGSDIVQLRGGNWLQKEKYAQKKYPRIQLQLRQMDLAREQLPACALTIGVHPEATRDKIWADIFANLVRSMKSRGVCIIATYFEIEMQAVQRLCGPLGVSFEVYENPYYKTHPVDLSPSLRFLLLARCRGTGTPELP